MKLLEKMMANVSFQQFFGVQDPDSYLNWLHFQTLTAEQKESFLDKKEHGKLGIPMKFWHIGAKEADLDDEGIKQLYGVVYEILQNMRNVSKNNKNALVDAPVQNFIGQNWNSVFPEINIEDYIKQYTPEAIANELENLFNNGMGNSNWGYGQPITQSLIYRVRRGNLTPQVVERIANLRQNYPNSVILDGVAKGCEEYFNKLKPSNINIAKFKGNYKYLLKDVFSNGLIKPKFIDYLKKISSNDDSPNSGAAKEIYDNFEYINEKLKLETIPVDKEDEFTGFQKAANKIKQLRQNHLDKINSKHLSHVYESSDAFEIMQAKIEFGGYKSTDGLDKFVSGLDKLDISQSAKDVVKSLKANLEGIKNSYPEMYSGALRNAKQMNALVQEVIKNLVNAPVWNESVAKSVLECLFVLKQGALQSESRDNFKKLDWGLFQGMPGFDKGPLQFFAKSADVGINMFARGIFEVGSLIKNNLINSKKELNSDLSKNPRLAKSVDYFNGKSGDINKKIADANQNIAAKQLVVDDIKQNIGNVIDVNTSPVNINNDEALYDYLISLKNKVDWYTQDNMIEQQDIDNLNRLFVFDMSTKTNAEMEAVSKDFEEKIKALGEVFAARENLSKVQNESKSVDIKKNNMQMLVDYWNSLSSNENIKQNAETIDYTDENGVKQVIDIDARSVSRQDKNPFKNHNKVQDNFTQAKFNLQQLLAKKGKTANKADMDKLLQNYKSYSMA